MPGELVYFWIPTADSGQAREFYGGLFGWEFSEGNVPDGFQIERSSPPGGLHGGSQPSTPQVCFSVERIDAAIERVRELGGEVEEPRRTSSGSYAMCRDDQGGEFCIWAPDS